MRARTLLISVLLVASMVAPGVTTPAEGAPGPGPLDSTVRHSAGFNNTSYVDGASETIVTTIFYPATSEGEDAPRDASAAPYPVLLLVPHQGVRPAYVHYGSYGTFLAERGFVVAMVELTPYEASPPFDYEVMGSSVLDALGFVRTESARTGSPIEGMANTSAMALAGHGLGARVALHAAYDDDQDAVGGVACLGLWDPATGPSDDPVAGQANRLEGPLSLQSGPGNAYIAASVQAFSAKDVGYVSYMSVEGANFTQYVDGAWPLPPVSWDPEADLGQQDQHNLTRKYLLAFLDRHLKGDAAAGDKLYGAQARADADTGVLAAWSYGVLDQGLGVSLPVNGSVVPTGPMDVCATVSNTCPFPMPSRNVTLEVVRIVGQNLVRVWPLENRTVPAQAAGAESQLGWTPWFDTYGQYRLFVRMGDPDHNTTNDRVAVDFDVSPLISPSIEHDPPGSLELGIPYNLTCVASAPSGVQQVRLYYLDAEGLEYDVPMTEVDGTGEWYAHIPAQLTTGQVTYKIQAQAGNGAWNVTNPYYAPVLDGTPPVIDHIPPWASLPVGSEVDICATVTDNGNVASVKLAYDDPTTGSHNVSCGRDGDVWFYPVVLGPGAGDLVYEWYAVDTWGNTASLGPITVPVVDGGPPTIEVVEPDPAELGDEVLLEARVTDDALVTEVWVTYTPPGGGEEGNGTPVVAGQLWRLSLEGIETPGDLLYSWWARDVNGNTNTTGQLTLPVLDGTPPSIAGVAAGNLTVGPSPWVEATVTDAGGLVSVTIEYTNVTGGTGASTMVQVLPDLYIGHIPPQTVGGQLVYRVVAEDASGNRATSGDRTAVVRDVDPPVITHVRPTDLVEGQEVTFVVEVVDNVGVAEVLLFLRQSGSPSFSEIEMEAIGGDQYAHTLPPGELRYPAVYYYFSAEDLPPSSNVEMLPEDAPDEGFIVGVAQLELRLHGTVRASGGDVLDGTAVTLWNDVYSNVTSAGPDGGYEFTGLVAGTYTLTVDRRGYETFETTLVLTVEGGDRRLDVSLVPKAGGDDGGTTEWLLYLAVVIIIIAMVPPLLVMRRRGGGG